MPARRSYRKLSETDRARALDCLDAGMGSRKVVGRITKTCLFKYTENFQIKNSDIFHISAQTWIVGTRYNRGGSNEYPQSML